MKMIFILMTFLFSLTATAQNSFIQCDAKVPGYQRFRMTMNFEDLSNPGLFLFVIQGGVMGHWQIRGLNVSSDNTITKTKFMLNESDFAILAMPNDIFEADFNETFESTLETANGVHETNCFAVK